MHETETKRRNLDSNPSLKGENSIEPHEALSTLQAKKAFTSERPSKDVSPRRGGGFKPLFSGNG